MSALIKGGYEGNEFQKWEFKSVNDLSGQKDIDKPYYVPKKEEAIEEEEGPCFRIMYITNKQDKEDNYCLQDLGDEAEY